jgi:putative membrane protein
MKPPAKSGARDILYRRARQAATAGTRVATITARRVKMKSRENCGDGSVTRGLICGALGGLIGAYTMNQFQAGLSKLSGPKAESNNQQSGDDATVKVASAISKSTTGHDLAPDEKEVAGPAVHYAFGATMGALYGALTEMSPKFAMGWGAPFATALWFGADELALPALGLTKAPSAYPMSTHTSALASHLVYGLSVDAVRRGVRAAF